MLNFWNSCQAKTGISTTICWGNVSADSLPHLNIIDYLITFTLKVFMAPCFWRRRRVPLRLWLPLRPHRVQSPDHLGPQQLQPSPSRRNFRRGFCRWRLAAKSRSSLENGQHHSTGSGQIKILLSQQLRIT